MKRDKGTEFRMARLEEGVREAQLLKNATRAPYPLARDIVLLVAARMQGDTFVDRLEAACAELEIAVPTRSSRRRSTK